MKKFYIISTFTLLLAGIACNDDILDTKPYDQKVTGNFFQTPDDAWQALVACYSALDWGYDEHIITISEAASDNCYGAGGAADDYRYQVFDDFDALAFVDPHPKLWHQFWAGIYRTNLLLANIDRVDWADDTTKKVQYIAEAKFLRAYYYFETVKVFGNIPLVTEPLDPNSISAPQEKPAVIYRQIAEDLKFAAGNLPKTTYSEADAAINGGKATKWAAEALMGRVFLFYTGYYNQPDIDGFITKQNVRLMIDDVIENSGHGLIDNFESLWQYSDESATIGGPNNFAGEDNKEAVFVIKYTYKGTNDANRHNGARWQTMVGLRTQPIPKYLAPWGEGWGVCSVYPGLWNAYEAGDTRREGTIICWDSLHLPLPINTSDSREYTGFNWKKYCPLADSTGTRLALTMGGNAFNSNYQDFYDIRFADVLLMGAELYLDGDLGKAQGYYDRVRDRAFLDGVHRKTLSAAGGKDLIFEERRLELALEAQRYFDLLRYDGIAGNFAYASQKIETTVPFEQHFNPITLGLMEIPNAEISLMKGWVQNPGWE